MRHPVDFRNFKAVFFDWDNTLVNTWPGILSATNAVLKHFGKSEISLEEVKIRARLSSREGFPQYFGENWQKALSLFYKKIEENKDNIKLCEGAITFVEALKKTNKIIAIISNKRNDLLKSEVERFKIPSNLILGSGDTPFDKPNPEMGLVALKCLKLKPNQVVYVGDSITDWIFSKNLHMPAIAIGEDAYEGPLLARFSSLYEAMQESIF